MFLCLEIFIKFYCVESNMKVMAPWVEAEFHLRMKGKKEGSKLNRVQIELVCSDTGFSQFCDTNLADVQNMVTAFLSGVNEGNSKRRVKITIDPRVEQHLTPEDWQQVRNWFVVHNSKMIATK